MVFKVKKHLLLSYFLIFCTISFPFFLEKQNKLSFTHGEYLLSFFSVLRENAVDGQTFLASICQVAKTS